jgi:hypothetical protein
VDVGVGRRRGLWVFVGYPVCLRGHAASCNEEPAGSALLDHSSVVHELAEGEDNHTALGEYHVHPDAPDLVVGSQGRVA